MKDRKVNPAARKNIAQVCMSLQDRLGLAKVKYELGRLGASDLKDWRNHRSDSDRPSDSSSEITYSRYETPFTSSPARNATFSHELPRSAKNKHAATFNPEVIQPMLNASRKRIRSNSITDRPAKVPKLSWKASHHLPESSPVHARQLQIYSNHPPSYDVPSSGLSASDEENDPELPVPRARNVSSSMVSSSPPRTPTLRQARLPRTDKDTGNEDGADLLLFLANSPTPARVNTKTQTRDFPPSTPPSQYAALPNMTPTPGGGLFGNFGTPSQQFNFSDFVNVTPSPAQRPWGGRTPGSLSKTPLLRTARKSLNFDNLVPPDVHSPVGHSKDTGLALQLGEELRP
ncbi:conserved hypothetical protein [Talaromyces stipitatus ATCC 10500]|uniref:Uncharacterized protein n=1 Tax=Talaromyces stipitatus (strain ATCC 10500 / CBS 375.48 / QM 6759 / NRRL 1006) TaxID=441959 RepID=B8M5M8_TALSN|nr:uncharacterized protein TSTA_031810 [Talaromyces stipitatus ATCC 10500]EED19922.1 conserved hypothetical protein [Talaromyces stipitatus ATCC 10500]